MNSDSHNLDMKYQEIIRSEVPANVSPTSSSSSTLYLYWQVSGLYIQDQMRSQDGNTNLFFRTTVFGGRVIGSPQQQLLIECVIVKNAMIKK